jgi:hypothetical protein
MSIAWPFRKLQWSVALTGAAEHRAFMLGLGLREIGPRAFSPFFREIVEVELADDPDEPISRSSTVWPGWMLGPLLIAREGIRARGGMRHVTPSIAEAPQIYWTYARHYRRAADRSHGWGHNSQWATRFRRDYALGGLLHYNVDARTDGPPGPPDDDEDPLTLNELHELVRHRCFVRCRKRQTDRWPDDTRLTEPDADAP